MEDTTDSDGKPSLHALTRRQRECMLLVKQGRTSKQIARELGISHRTVEQHVATALETLGVKTRMAAVAMLFEIEREDAPPTEAQPFLLRTAGNPAEAYVGAGPEVIEKAEREGGGLSDVNPRARRHSALSIVPPLGGKRNIATKAERSVWILRIAVLAIMLTGVLILSILGVSEMAREVGP